VDLTNATFPRGDQQPDAFGVITTVADGTNNDVPVHRRRDARLAPSLCSRESLFVRLVVFHIGLEAATRRWTEIEVGNIDFCDKAELALYSGQAKVASELL